MGVFLKFTDVKEYIENYSYQVISSEYIRATEKLKLICDKGHECEISWNNFKNGKRCKICAREKLENIIKLDINIVIEDIENNNYTYISHHYKNKHLRIKIKCNKHQYIYETSYSNFKNGRRCKYCSEENRIEKIRKKNEIKFVERLNKISNNTFVLKSKYINNIT